MFVEQGCCVEIVLVKMDPVMPLQVTASLQADLLTAGQAWVAKLQGPAQVTLPRHHFVDAGKGIANIVSVGVPLRELGAQSAQPLDLMQRIAAGAAP